MLKFLIRKQLLVLSLLLIAFGCTKNTKQEDSSKKKIIALTGEVKQYKGKPTIHISGKPESPVIYALPDVPGGRWSWDEIPQHNINQFCQQGVKLYQLDIFLDHLWFEDGSFNVKKAQQQINGVLEVCPDASVFFRFHVNAPKWWIAQNSAENVLYDGVDGSPDENIGLSRLLEADPRTPIRSSMASEKWKKVTSEKLAEFCTAFSKTKEGNVLIGIQVAYGVYGEWHQWGINKNEADFSLPMQNHFKHWLKTKYTTNEQLQKAWNDTKITFETVTVPTTKEREIISAGIFRDPNKDMKVIDYYTCQHDLVADNIIHFSKVVKENWSRPIITGTFYGYFFSVFGRQAAGGHLSLQKILNSKYVDYLSGPQAYYTENGYHSGEPYRSRSLIHSVFLNNKLWLDEYDQQPRRTWPYLAVDDNREVYKKTVKDNISQIRRNMLFSLLKGQGLWLYDFGPASMHLNPDNDTNKQSGTNGYWDNPIYMDNIGKVKKIADKFLHKEFASAADVLAVYDTESIKYMPSTIDKSPPITHQLLNWTSLALYYSGAIFDPIHIDDLDKVNLSQYKAVVFFNTFKMEEKDKEIIKTKVATQNRHLIWIYAPAYINGKELNVASVSDIVNINLKTTLYSKTPKIKINKNFATVPEQSAWMPYDPVFYIDDDVTEILGSYAGLNKAGFGYKKSEQFSSWYIGVPIVDYQIFNKIFEKAGVKKHAEEKDIVYGGGDLIMIHSVKKGTKEFSNNDKKFQIAFDSVPATKVINKVTGEVILN